MQKKKRKKLFNQIFSCRYSTQTMQFTYACGTCVMFGNFKITSVLLWGTQVMNALLLIGYVVFLISVKMKTYLYSKKKRLTSTDARLVSFYATCLLKFSKEFCLIQKNFTTHKSITIYYCVRI